MDDPCDRRRDEGQRHELPDMSSRDEDDEVAGEGPHDRTQDRGNTIHSERPHKQIEASEHSEEEPTIARQEAERPLKCQHILDTSDDPYRGIGGRYLIHGHPSKETIRPVGEFS